MFQVRNKEAIRLLTGRQMKKNRQSHHPDLHPVFRAVYGGRRDSGSGAAEHDARIRKLGAGCDQVFVHAGI